MRHIEGTADMTALRGAGNGRCAGGVISAGRMRNALATIVVVGSVGLIPATSSMSATPGLVAAYGFEEGSGDSIADVSGGGHDGSIVNATWAQSGVYGSALRFDGSGARVIVPDSAALHLASAMTLEAWVKPSAVSNVWRDVIGKGGDYYVASSTRKGRRPAGGGIFDGVSGNVVGSSAIPSGTWTYLALTYDGSQLKLYRDGRQVSSVRQNGTLASSVAPLAIGADSFYGQYFQGLIDEVRVYDLARTGDEIRADMASPIGGAAAPDVEPPSAPGVVVAVASAADRVELSWGAASDNVGVTGYEVERCLGAGCTDFGLLATTSSVGYVDGSVAAAATYRFRVRARDAAGNVGGYADAVTVTTPAGPDVEPPSAPGVVVAVASAADRVELSWGAASDNVGVTGYEVERCLGAGCTDFGLLATTSSVGYVDSSVAAAATYRFRVRARDAAGNVVVMRMR